MIDWFLSNEPSAIRESIVQQHNGRRTAKESYKRKQAADPTWTKKAKAREVTPSGTDRRQNAAADTSYLDSRFDFSGSEGIK